MKSFTEYIESDLYSGWVECILHEPLDMKDGIYDGTQSAYDVKLNERDSEIKVKNGIRGLNFPYNFKVENGRLYKQYKR